jgi:hypothetical protein
MLNVNNKKNDIAENQQKERNSQKKEERKWIYIKLITDCRK